MKKFILSVALVAASVMGASAQEIVSANASSYKYVAPITIECMPVNTETLRDSAGGNLEYYIAILNETLKKLEVEKKDLESATKSLKLEKDLYNGEKGLFTSRKKQLEGLKKSLQSDIKVFDSHLKDIKKQYDVIKKMDNASCDAIKEQHKRLQALEETYKAQKSKLQDLLEDLSKNADTEVNNNFAILNNFLIELTDKETRLKNLASQNKANIDIVKAAIKTAKGK